MKAGKRTFRNLIGLLLAAAVPAGAADAAGAAKPLRSGHVPANGIRYYYEVHGQGEPLLLLHGGLGSIDMFGPVLPALAASRQVVAVDMPGHGRTELGDRTIDIPAMADDVAAVVKSLGYGPIDVLGYSMGGAVAFRLGVQHPEAVRRMALVSAGF